MQPITQNITFVRGDTLQFDVHLTDVEATVESMFFKQLITGLKTEIKMDYEIE